MSSYRECFETSGPRLSRVVLRENITIITIPGKFDIARLEVALANYRYYHFLKNSDQFSPPDKLLNFNCFWFESIVFSIVRRVVSYPHTLSHFEIDALHGNFLINNALNKILFTQVKRL